MSGLFSSKRLRWFAAAIVILNGVFPALWILFTSLKTESELTQKPITYWPHEPTIANFISAFQDQPLLTFLTNSLIVAGLSTLLSLFISALAAYAIARLRLRFRGLILTAIIGVSMFPLVTLMVPLFEIMRSLGLLNSYWALVLPYTVLNLRSAPDDGQLFPGYSARYRKRGHARRLHPHQRPVAHRAAAGRTGRGDGRHPGVRELLG